ncbi:uncharacterized protein PHACADRAFT_206398 [Phanerochaete carnosa HHB-10118-sp]|uniref:LysM domain-containing protein n=1 Tax=Phanerochaete carnosa (strain HHB-10118-sp) TaxID=650164 RepID=K5X3U9_PHACS|nr:uncharacterized protein PHACADRAFT_206398 [Phanerochaete carnosa HHB-10118-sp]EKM57497.1 hypothetical protein PHACADRAFT_206398 [Phanerochaete carnosa HHB-10118-sp]
MAHPVFWPTKTFYYPVGNTCPMLLLQHVPPESDAAILLLGCGDPRSILHTVYSTEVDQVDVKRKLDFTCCDHEPAILARNIILLTLVFDNKHSQDVTRLWNIFYHFLLDDSSRDVLLSQSQKLADLSVDLKSWATSEYSTFLQIGSRFTLAELHRHWALYARTESFSAAQHKQHKEIFLTGMRKAYNDNFKDLGESFYDGSTSRSAGPLSFDSADICAESSRKFWKTGVLSTSQNDVRNAIHVNPTFFYATDGEGFLPHYGTHPLTAFHLAPVFANAKQSSPSLASVYENVRIRFRQWCESFYACIRATPNPTIKIRVLVGDVLSICQALQIVGAGGEAGTLPRVGTLHADLAILDGGDYVDGIAPLKFDVIDTSNLCDHIGALNILISTVPLLKHTPCATIHTETLLPYTEDPLFAISERLCSDLTTASVLLDLTPVSYLSGYTTDSNVHEIIGFQARQGGQFHERLAWKIPSLLISDGSPAATFEPAQLASLLFNIYLRMFAHEDVTRMFRRQASIRLLERQEMVRYCRRSFAALLRCVRARVEADWDGVFAALLSRIIDDNTLSIGGLYYQDLLTQLHLLGLHSEPNFRANDSLALKNKALGRFRNWTTVPPVVCIAFSVDRLQLRAIEEDGAPMHPQFTVQLSGLARDWANDFAYVEMMFGVLSVKGRDENAVATVRADPRGRHSTAPVVVCVCVPSWILAHDPRATVVRLGLTSTPSTCQLLPRLGSRLTLFEVSLTDEKYLHVLRSRPALSGDSPAAIPYLPVQLDTPPMDTVAVTAEGSRVTHVTRRVEVEEPLAKAALASATTSVSVIQTAASAVRLAIGPDVRFDLGFPFSIDASRIKLRVARKSSWVEVVLPLQLLGQSSVPVQHRFPMTAAEMSFFPWNIHRINLERLPTLSTGDVGGLEWLNTLASVALSDGERAAREGGTLDALGRVKDSLHTIFVCAAGLQGPTKPRPAQVFGLDRTSQGGMDTLFFVTGLRLDVASHSAIADAFVLPLTNVLVSRLQRALPSLVPEIVHIVVNDAECAAWKALLPALAERCRTWAHTAQCAYALHGRVPLSVQHSEVPICDCGKGKVTDAFRRRRDWAPFLPHVTRVAISLLFAVSYLEPVAAKMKELLDRTDTRNYRNTSGLAAPLSGNERAGDRCARCKSILPVGKRMVCSRCKKVVYCGLKSNYQTLASKMRTFAVSAAATFVAAWGVALIMASGPSSECVEIYNSQPTDSCASIESWSGLTTEQLMALNPDLHDCGPPMDVHEVCLDSYTPPCFLWVPANETTCDNLAVQWEISVALFVQYNDNVDDACDDLIIGEEYCVSIDFCYPGQTNPCCLPGSAC